MSQVDPAAAVPIVAETTTPSIADNAAAPTSTAVAAVPAAATSSSSVAAATVRPSTTVIHGSTFNDETGEDEEFTIEAIPLSQLSSGDSDKLQSLANKVLRYFEQEAEEEKAAAATAAETTGSDPTPAAASASFADVFGSLALAPSSSSKPPSAQ